MVGTIQNTEQPTVPPARTSEITVKIGMQRYNVQEKNSRIGSLKDAQKWSVFKELLQQLGTNENILTAEDLLVMIDEKTKRKLHILCNS